MQNRFLQAGGTVCIDTPRSGFTFLSHDAPAADWTFCRDAEIVPLLSIFVARRQINPDYFRYYVTTALDHHDVAHFQPKSLNLIFVVERGTADRDSAYCNGFEERNRCECSRSAYLYSDVQNTRGSLFRRILVRDRPPRRF